MAGHSKWSKVIHIEGPLDLKRGQRFSKLTQEITVASRLGASDPASGGGLSLTALPAEVQSMRDGHFGPAAEAFAPLSA